MKLWLTESVDLFATWDMLLRRRYQVHISVSLPALVKMAVSEVTRDEAQKMLPAELGKGKKEHERN